MTSLTVTSGEALDARAFWMTLGQRATGMTVVTADSDDGFTGFLGLSAAHVTAQPPTMLVSVDRKTSALAGIDRRHFAVNFLPADAVAVAEASPKAGVSGAARFAAGQWACIVHWVPRCSAMPSAPSTAPSTKFWIGPTYRSLSARSSLSPRGRTGID